MGEIFGLLYEVDVDVYKRVASGLEHRTTFYFPIREREPRATVSILHQEGNNYFALKRTTKTPNPRPPPEEFDKWRGFALVAQTSLDFSRIFAVALMSVFVGSGVTFVVIHLGFNVFKA